MIYSKLAIVGLGCFLNQPFTAQNFSAFIYDGKTTNNCQNDRTSSQDFAINSFRDIYNILSEISDQALRDCQTNNSQKVALITVNSEIKKDEAKALLRKLSDYGSFLVTHYNLDGQKDCLPKALEIARFLLTAKKVDIVIINAISTNCDQNFRSFGSESVGESLNSDIKMISAGAIVIKDVETARQNGDRIYAVIETVTCLTHDISRSPARIQQSCQQAFQKARVDPRNIGYLEIVDQNIAEHSPEFLALIEAYKTKDHDLSCAVGSVRANFNFLGIAVGTISLIKTALCLYNRYLPPYPQWSKPQDSEVWQNSPFFVPTKPHPWFLDRGQEKRQAAINLVSEDGTYSHIILSEETEQKIHDNGYLAQSSFYLFPIAASDRVSLQHKLDELANKIDCSSSLSQTARENFEQFQNGILSPYVVSIVGDCLKNLQKEIKQAKKGIEKAFERATPWKSPKGSYFTPNPLGQDGKIAFVYPGAFNSYLGMGRNIWQLFPQLWERAASLVQHPGNFFQEKQLYHRSQYSLSKKELEIVESEFMANPLSLLLTGTGFAVMFTDIIQNCFKIQPQLAFGYSMGESSMMYSLGIWSNINEVSQFVHSSPLFQSRLSGSKQAVLEYWSESAAENLWSSYVLIASPEVVKEYLEQEPRVYLTHVNSPQEVVIAGEPEGCLRAIASLECDSFRSPSDMVLHCSPMHSELATLKKLNTVTMGEVSDTVFYSSADYQPIPLEQSAIAQRLGQGVCQPLEFPRLVDRAYQDGARIFLELGSGGSCSRLIKETLNAQDREHLALCINRRGADDLTVIVKMLAQLVSHKVDLNLSPLYFAPKTVTKNFTTTTSLAPEIPTVKTRISPVIESKKLINNEVRGNFVVPRRSLSDKNSHSCLFNEEDVLEFIEGKVSQVFGNNYQEIDNYARRVRMPSPPFLFVSRVTQLEGTLGNYQSGFIETEYDIPQDAWYAIDGQLTVGICKEAGHGLLMLLSYLGTDFESKGERSFRLLDLSATFLFEQPENIKTLRCRIRITSSVTTEDSLLVFFQGEALIGDRVWMTLHDGCAGIFSDEELEQGQGIVVSESETQKLQQTPQQQFIPLLDCIKNSFQKAEILHLSKGDIAACFGHQYQQHGFNKSLRLPPKKLLMLENVMLVDSQGGVAGLGSAIGSKQVTPEDWYFKCHFRNDPTMPGNLMIEGCIQLVQFYCLFLGLQTQTQDARFQIIPGKTQIARFRGQVTPQTGTLMYQMEVFEIGTSPQPYIVANVDVIFGGKTIATIKDIGVKLAEKPAKLQNSLTKSETRSILFNEEQLKQFAKGSVADCLGAEFAIYDDRQSVRLPNGDLRLVSRVLKISGNRHELDKPAQIITEYDVKPNAWFYEHNAHSSLPYFAHIEIAGQPCIFLGVYMGATLLSPDDDLHFRNLDGEGTILKEIDLRNKTITDKVQLISTTDIKGAIIQKFEFELSCEGEIFYRGRMVFGDFSTAVLANQVGLDGGKRLEPWYKKPDSSTFNAIAISLKDSHWREKLYQTNPSKPHYHLSSKHLDFLDEVVVIEEGGDYQQSYLYATKSITADDWYFPFHFYQDPVMPGALGIESIIQAIQTYALYADLGKSLQNPRFAQAVNHQITWKYRGQITPENNLMSLEVHISKIDIESNRVTIIGDASLWKEDLRIYEIKDLAVCLVEA